MDVSLHSASSKNVTLYICRTNMSDALHPTVPSMMKKP